MPIGFDRDDARRRVLITVHGAFEAVEILAAIERQGVEQTWSYGVLYDLRGMTGAPTMDDLRKIFSESVPKRSTESGGGPIALLVTDSVLYGLACTYAALGRSKMTIEVFRDWDDAESWLAAHANP